MNAKLIPYRVELTGRKFTFKDDNSRSSSKMYFKNPSNSQYWKVQIDGNVYPKGSEAERCDFYMEHAQQFHEYFIELKGTHIEKAYHQLKSSINEFSMAKNGGVAKLRAFIVPKKYPSAGTDAQIYKKRFRTEYKNGRLEIRNSGFTFDLDADKVI